MKDAAFAVADSDDEEGDELLALQLPRTATPPSLRRASETLIGTPDTGKLSVRSGDTGAFSMPSPPSAIASTVDTVGSDIKLVSAIDGAGGTHPVAGDASSDYDEDEVDVLVRRPRRT